MDGEKSGVLCPNDSDHGELSFGEDYRDCAQCGYVEPRPSIHDADTKEIVRVPVCEADGCERVSDDITIVVGGQKRQVCDICAEQHYANLDQQHIESNIIIDEEREEGIDRGGE